KKDDIEIYSESNIPEIISKEEQEKIDELIKLLTPIESPELLLDDSDIDMSKWDALGDISEVIVDTDDDIATRLAAMYEELEAIKPDDIKIEPIELPELSIEAVEQPKIELPEIKTPLIIPEKEEDLVEVENIKHENKHLKELY
ncbi:MAG: hypothetical protein ACKPFF_15160, partial [Planktothrix sp.]